MDKKTKKMEKSDSPRLRRGVYGWFAVYRLLFIVSGLSFHVIA